MQSANTTTDPKAIFRDAPIMASFAVDDLDAARTFYGRTLGLDVRDGRQPGILEIHGKESGPCWSTRSLIINLPSSRC